MNTQSDTDLTVDELEALESALYYKDAFIVDEVGEPYSRGLLTKLLAAARKGLRIQRMIDSSADVDAIADALKHPWAPDRPKPSVEQAQNEATNESILAMSGIKPEPSLSQYVESDRGGADFQSNTDTLPQAMLSTLVDAFSGALYKKLVAAEEKYGWNNGWRKTDWADDLRRDIRKHVEKGDPRDVAAYCAFAWFHGWTLSEPSPSVEGRKPWEDAQTGDEIIQEASDGLKQRLKEAVASAEAVDVEGLDAQLNEIADQIDRLFLQHPTNVSNLRPLDAHSIRRAADTFTKLVQDRDTQRDGWRDAVKRCNALLQDNNEVSKQAIRLRGERSHYKAKHEAAEDMLREADKVTAQAVAERDAEHERGTIWMRVAKELEDSQDKWCRRAVVAEAECETLQQEVQRLRDLLRRASGYFGCSPAPDAFAEKVRAALGLDT